MTLSKLTTKLSTVWLALGVALAPAITFAQATTPAATTTTPAAPAMTMDKGDNTWMLVSSALVLLMTVPGLALFYGGLVRTKNMLSVLMQVLTIAAVVSLIWIAFGYSMAFTNGGPLNSFVGGFSKVFLNGVA